MAFNVADVKTNHDLATNNDNEEQSVKGKNLINQRVKSNKENVMLGTVVKMLLETQRSHPSHCISVSRNNILRA